MTRTFLRKIVIKPQNCSIMIMFWIGIFRFFSKKITNFFFIMKKKQVLRPYICGYRNTGVPLSMLVIIFSKVCYLDNVLWLIFFSPSHCIDLTWINNVHTCLKCNLVNFETPNGFKYYGNDFGISKLTRLQKRI